MLHPSAPRFSAVVVIAAAVLSSCARKQPNAVETHVADESSKRSLASGELVGFAHEDKKTQSWLGIPFAQPPVGALRWRAPQPPAHWNGVRDSLRVGSACPQYASVLSDAVNAATGSLTGSEDCLYLNVFAPRGSAEDAAAQKRPVMVWFHGGSNVIGHGGSYDGTELAARYGVIVITTNYRLGPFGWFRQSALVANQNGDEQSGNWGTLDQIRALAWVQQNVAAFGGDPNNVTIFGESAGGSDVFSLLVSPRAQGLFAHAIVESGGTNTRSLSAAENAIDAAQPGDKNSSTETSARILFPKLARREAIAALQALEPGELARRLRAAAPAQVFAAYAPDGPNRAGTLEMPILIRDGYTLPLEETPELLAQGRYNHVPVMLGTNRDELKLFLANDPKYVRQVFGMLPSIRDEQRYQTTSDYGTMSWKMTGADRPAAAMRQAQGASVYVYRFDWDEEPKLLWSDFAKLYGAAHGMEIAFVFHRFVGGFERLFTDENRSGREQLADAMSSYWANFAYLGTPGRGRSGKLPEWSAVDLGTQGAKQMVLDTAAGGGVRMDKESVTKPSLLARLAHDARLNDAQRCETFHGLVEHDALIESDREASGCSEKGWKALAAR